MEKLYIIRKVVFFHNDIDNVRMGLGDVIGVFDNYDQAQIAYLTCERHQHQQWYLSNFEVGTAKGLVKKMQSFYQQYFPQIPHFKEITKIPTLPTEATLAQTAEFIKLSGLQHYDLSVHEQIPMYYKIQMVDDFWGEMEDFPFTIFPTEVSGLYFLQESLEKATQEALSVAFSYLWQDMLEETNANFVGLQGELTVLSKTPDKLKDYLQNCEILCYDEAKNKICLSSKAEDAKMENVLEELRSLFALLMLNPFHIIPIDLKTMTNKSVKVEESIFL